nr:hypothetical protein [Parabacteroides goldsteinii]
MKRYVYTTSTRLMVLLFIGACLFNGCSEEEAVGPGKETGNGPSLSIMAAVNPSIPTRASDDPSTDTRNTNGSWIKDLTIFLFATNATDSDTPLFTKTIKVTGNPAQLNQANRMQLTADELKRAGIGFGSHVTIYAIANHIPANAETLTKKQVISQTATLPKYQQAGSWGMSVVPMSGTNPDYEITSSDNQTISLVMQRAVIRIAVTITDAEFDNDKYLTGNYNWGINSIKLYNDFAATYLWNEGIPSDPACRTENAGIGTTTPLYPTSENLTIGTFYLNCNETSAVHTTSAPIKVKVNGIRYNENNIETPFEYTIDLKKSDGSYTFERNTSLTANLTLKAGSVELKTEVLPWDGEVDASGAEKPMDIAPKANCYIVKPGSTILIPVSQVQDAYNFNSTITPIAADEKLTTELIWTDVKGATSGKGLANDASVAEIEVLGKGPDALLRVVAGTQPGNSVVAIHTGFEDRWSWHIWVTDYDPETDNIVNGAYTFMDRNLGALSNTPSSSGDNSTGVVGTYYQWGRHTPLQSKAFSGNSAALIYDADGIIQIQEQVVPISIGQVSQRPLSFFTSNYSAKQELWDNGGKKTPLDPCPAGWRVPLKTAWDGVSFGEVKTNGVQTDAGFYPTSQAFMAFNSIDGKFKPFFWTASTYLENRPYCYNGNSEHFSDMPDYYGLPVRCVKE